MEAEKFDRLFDVGESVLPYADLSSAERPNGSMKLEAQECSIDDLEDAYLAEAAYERFKASGEKAIPLEDVMQEYGMER